MRERLLSALSSIKKAVCLFVSQAFLSHPDVLIHSMMWMAFHREKTASESKRESSEKNFNPLIHEWLKIKELSFYGLCDNISGRFHLP